MSIQYYQDLGLFLAHAIELEKEAAERLEDIAQMMEVHNNNGLQALFQELAKESAKHEQVIRELTKDIQLPVLKPWEYQWLGTEAPETGDISELSYLMTIRQALEFVLRAEKKAQQFYLYAVEKTDNEKIKQYAGSFADEEAEHVRLIEQRLEQCPKKNPDWFEDLDSPNMPE